MFAYACTKSPANYLLLTLNLIMSCIVYGWQAQTLRRASIFFHFHLRNEYSAISRRCEMRQYVTLLRRIQFKKNGQLFIAFMASGFDIFFTKATESQREKQYPRLIYLEKQKFLILKFCIFALVKKKKFPSFLVFTIMIVFIYTKTHSFNCNYGTGSVCKNHNKVC